MKNVLLSVAAFVIYIAAIGLLPFNGTYFTHTVMAVCAVVLGFWGANWSWLKVAPFMILVLGFHVALLFFITSSSIPRLSLANRLIYVLKGNGLMMFEYLVIMLVAAGAGYYTKKFIKKASPQDA